MRETIWLFGEASEIPPLQKIGFALHLRISMLIEKEGEALLNEKDNLS